MIIPSLAAGAYSGLPRPAIPAATTATTIVVRVGSALGAAVFAVVLQIAVRHRAEPAAAFATSFRWALGCAAVALIPALLIPRATAPATDTANQPVPADR